MAHADENWTAKIGSDVDESQNNIDERGRPLWALKEGPTSDRSVLGRGENAGTTETEEPAGG